jgi:hypothetical protein
MWPQGRERIGHLARAAAFAEGRAVHVTFDATRDHLCSGWWLGMGQQGGNRQRLLHHQTVLDGVVTD